jgi:hypothetical protein
VRPAGELSTVELMRDAADGFDVLATANMWITTTWGPRESAARATALRARADRLEAAVHAGPCDQCEDLVVYVNRPDTPPTPAPGGTHEG